MEAVASATNGHAWTPEEVFKVHGPRVYHLARRMLGNDADAEDVAQDVLLNVVRKLDSFRGQSALPTWLHRVTVNAALAHRQKRGRIEEHEIPDPLEKFQEDGHHAHAVYPWSVTPDKVAQDREMKEKIEKAIGNLPTRYRDVFVLADVEGMPNQDIAEMLELNVPGVKSRLHRARLLRRDALAPHFEEQL